MLLITNGDSAADQVRRSGLPGEVLPWRDVLHEGPVPSGLSIDDLREVRARFIAEQGWGDFDELMSCFARRDATLAGFRDHEEVVLLFEHDLYDQLQLIQVLDWFGQQNLGATKLSRVHADEYLGTPAPDRMRDLFQDRCEVSARELGLGRDAWEAFGSPDPMRISTLVREDTSAVPFLRDALLRHLEQFPSVENGLSRSEAQALEVISGGGSVLRDAFIASHQEREELIFLSDAVFASYLEGLSRVSNPLVLLEDDAEIRAPRGSVDHSKFWDSKAIVTESGLAVLEGREDRIELNGLDRWLGGVRLGGDEARWRWNASAHRLQRAA